MAGVRWGAHWAWLLLWCVASTAHGQGSTTPPVPWRVTTLAEVLGSDLPGAKVVALKAGSLVGIDLAGGRTWAIHTFAEQRGSGLGGIGRPWWSPDGQTVLGSYMGQCWDLAADGSRQTPLLEGVAAYEPIPWIDPATGHRCIVYKTTDIPDRYPANVGTGKTILRDLVTGVARELADYPFDAGLSLDGTRLGEAYIHCLMKDLVSGETRRLNYGGQACHGSMSPDNTYRIMHLNLVHSHIVVRDEFDVESLNIRIPPGGRSWQTPRWSNHPDYAMAVLRSGEERDYTMVVLNLRERRMAILGDLDAGWLLPHLWIASAQNLRPAGPIDALPLQRLAKYRDLLARVGDYSPIIAELTAIKDEDEARQIIAALDALARQRMEQAAQAPDGHQARAIYSLVATRFAALPVGKEASRILTSPQFAAEIAAATTLRRLNETAEQLQPVPDAQPRWSDAAYQERNGTRLMAMAADAAWILARCPGTRAEARARALVERFELPLHAFKQAIPRLTVIATIEAVSAVPSLQSIAPYRDAILYVRYRVARIVDGQYRQRRLIAAHWVIRDGKVLDTSGLSVGTRQRLVLEPLDAHPELRAVPPSQDADDPSLVPYWTLQAERAD